MVEQQVPALADGLRDDAFLEGECLGRIKVVARDVGQRDVCLHRNEVGGAIERLAAGREHPRLHCLGMAAFGHKFDALDLVIIRHRLELAGVEHRLPILRQITRTIPLVRRIRVGEFAL